MKFIKDKLPNKSIIKKIFICFFSFWGVIFIASEVSKHFFGKGFWHYLSYLLPFL